MAESSDKGLSAQYFRPNLQPIYHEQERVAEAERQRRLFTELDWYADPPPDGLTKPASPYMRLASEHHHALVQITDPTTLVLID